MRLNLLLIFLFPLLSPCNEAEIDISSHEQGIKHALSVKPNDVVIVRSASGPTAVLRFVSITETNLSWSWCFLGESPDTKCSEVETVAFTALPGGQRVIQVPGSRNVHVELGVLSEAVLKAGDISVRASRAAAGYVSLEYFREKARLDLLAAELPAKLNEQGGAKK